MLGWQVAAGLDWACLLHAYGPARETPDHLRALTGEDFEAQLSALDHLAFSVVHQYSVYPVTPFVVRVVGGILEHPALRRSGNSKRPLLAEVLDFLDEVADGTRAAHAAGAKSTTGLCWEDVNTTPGDVAGYFDGLARDTFAQQDCSSLDRLWEWSMADLHDALAELVDVIVPLTDDHDQSIRVRSICLLARLGGVSTVAPRAEELTSYFAARLESAQPRDERAAFVVGVGELGGHTGPWLTDSDEPIRVCAAVYLHNDPVATANLERALLHPKALHDWFTDTPWRHSGVQEALLQELVSRDLEFSDLLPVALAIAKHANKWFPDNDWGLLLRRAFPDVKFEPGVQPPPPRSLDESQRAYLDALLTNKELWDPTNGNCQLARMRAGIPKQRKEVVRLLRRLS